MFLDIVIVNKLLSYRGIINLYDEFDTCKIKEIIPLPMPLLLLSLLLFPTKKIYSGKKTFYSQTNPYDIHHFDQLFHR